MKYFGTDGIRGVVDCDLDSRLAYKVGIALGKQIIDNNQIKIVVIGNDTRVSNDVLKYSLACGLMDMGVDCIMVGIVPTACISYLVPKFECILWYYDNCLTQYMGDEWYKNIQ